MNHNSVVTHLEPDIQKCEVKAALGSITMNKTSGSDGIPVELFKITRGDAVKVLHSICQQILKTQQWTQDWNMSGFISIPKKVNAQECSNYHTTVLISHASKIMLKIFQARFQHYVNRELTDGQLGFKRKRNHRSNCQLLQDHGESKGVPQKNIYFFFNSYTEAFDYVDN